MDRILIRQRLQENNTVLLRYWLGHSYSCDPHAPTVPPVPTRCCLYIPVPIISDPAPIIALASEVCDGIKGYLVIFIDKHLQLPDTDP